MIAAAFAHDLAANVTGLTFAPDSTGGNVFTGREMPSTPDVAVLVSAPVVPMLDRLPHARVALQLIVRGGKRAESAHDDLVRAIVDHLDCRPAADIGAAPDVVSLIGCTFASEALLPLDENQRPEQSLNFRALISNPSTNRSLS